MSVSPPRLRMHEVRACDFSSWYHLFRKITIKSRTVPLPQYFLAYIASDSIILPQSVEGRCSSQLSDDEDLLEVDGGAGTTIEEFEGFAALNKQIQREMDALGGEVFVKLNWSAPIDARWINNGSLKCIHIEEIYLLLKSSDRLLYDIDHMYQSCEDFDPATDHRVTLVIRKWSNLHNSMEFRCFVRENILIGFCQRDTTTFYEFLSSQKEELSQLVPRFFEREIKDKFPLHSYAFDVYVDKNKRIWIIDFNVFGNPTSALLFDWDELSASPLHGREGHIDFRFVRSLAEVMPSDAGSSRGPIDVVAAEEFPNFMELCKRQHRSSDDMTEPPDVEARHFH